MTTYNHEKYITQALESVLMQRVNFGFEIVIIEDCSTDRTRDIVLEFQRRHPQRVRLLLAESNQCSNRDLAEAFETAPSQYVAWLDGDDFWTSKCKLQKQVDLLDSRPECSLCFHNVGIIDENGIRKPWNYNPADQKLDLTVDDLWALNPIAGCSPVFRKDLIGKIPAWYYTDPWGDWSLYILSAQWGKIKYIDEVMGMYRVHREGFWSRLSPISKLEETIGFLESMDRTLDFRYTKNIKAAVSDYRAKLTVEKTKAAGSEAQLEWQRKRVSDQQLVRRVRHVVRTTLPQNAPVTVVSNGNAELIKLDNRQAWHFQPTEDTGVEQLFAQGTNGSREAPWISAGPVYEFRLYSGTQRERLLDSVEVTRSDEAFIAASPNPVPAGSGTGATTIVFGTGDGSEGQVYLAAYEAVDAHYPADSREAIAQLETWRGKGAEFLVFPSKAFWWLEHYGAFGRHLEDRYQAVVRVEDACLIYALREQNPANEQTS